MHTDGIKHITLGPPVLTARSSDAHFHVNLLLGSRSQPDNSWRRTRRGAIVLGAIVCLLAVDLRTWLMGRALAVDLCTCC